MKNLNNLDNLDNVIWLCPKPDLSLYFVLLRYYYIGL